MKKHLRIGIVGGGPAALLLLKNLINTGREDLAVDIFERKSILGAGMPYSRDGSCDEHVSNVSGNELPPLPVGLEDWFGTLPSDTLARFSLNKEQFTAYKVVPRRLLGAYLCDQFNVLLSEAKTRGLPVGVHLHAAVTDIEDCPEKDAVQARLADGRHFEFDHIAICTGHDFPEHCEGRISGWFDSPYPPEKLKFRTPHPVAIRGASLTAIDAMRTLARQNGQFTTHTNGKARYTCDEESNGFELVLHSRNGLLPAVRFHLEDRRPQQDKLLSKETVAANKAANGGFLSLDMVFETAFKEPFKEKDPGFYAFIADMRLEDFVAAMMKHRENKDPFELLQGEYREAEESIKHKKSVYWKEMLADLSFTLNYPAKYFSAEDMQRLQQVLMPLITIVIASVPQSSVEEMLALHQAGFLKLVEVDPDSHVEPGPQGGADYYINDQAAPVHYETFVDCIGQPAIPFGQFPFQTLREKRTVTQARLQFQDPEIGRRQLSEGVAGISADQDGNYFLDVPGVAIDDSFAVVDAYGARNERIFLMAVPYMGGYNPDYSGLDFCDTAGNTIARAITGISE
ncbi:hypothetical protein C7T94_18965 [Pedobacter yulinensis]|uniref:FAD-dependent urate hydroxylase HpyO/Asp monooxygenase CreE-like FAD/NAD(P)-binding domain-containing protein n=1 Tax=Pedobacter yulinensis TaxID=2126353 RepID=A0A2T3HGI6_9SPHI|nr:FAD/NAD(P)-binding protein [Pedobacter yulinensis]PST81554.1 hypothetical protein C7T94_18965 [Pedobacter yulinensis]